MSVNFRVSIPHWARNGDTSRYGWKLIKQFLTAEQDFGLKGMIKETSRYTKPGEIRRQKEKQAEARKRAAALRDAGVVLPVKKKDKDKKKAKRGHEGQVFGFGRDGQGR